MLDFRDSQADRGTSVSSSVETFRPRPEPEECACVVVWASFRIAADSSVFWTVLRHYKPEIDTSRPVLESCKANISKPATTRVLATRDGTARERVVQRVSEVHCVVHRGPKLVRSVPLPESSAEE